MRVTNFTGKRGCNFDITSLDEQYQRRVKHLSLISAMINLALSVKDFSRCYQPAPEISRLFPEAVQPMDSDVTPA